MSIRWLAIAPGIGLCGAAAAQTANVLTLAAAPEAAIQHRPRIASASVTAKASAAVVKGSQNELDVPPGDRS